MTGSADAPEKTEAEHLVKQVREWFQERYKVVPPDCEDCLVYASGGEVLAFAPRKLAPALTEAIDSLYTQQTLIANSVAAWRACALMELRFGLRPGQFWLPEFSTLADESVRGLVRDYYRGLTPAAFLKRKTSGEVTSALALEKLRAREGNPSIRKPPKLLRALKRYRMPGVAAAASIAMLWLMRLWGHGCVSLVLESAPLGRKPKKRCLQLCDGLTMVALSGNRWLRRRGEHVLKNG